MPSNLVVCVCLALTWAPQWELRRAEGEHVQITVVQDVPLTKPELDMVQDQLTRIWRQQGVLPELTASAMRPGGLRLVFSGSSTRVSPGGPNLCSLGVIHFINGAPEPELTVSLTAVREFVRQAHPEWSPGVQTLIAARIAGRVAAHELGHYLLADSKHRRTGLMRAQFDGSDLLAPLVSPFAPPPHADVEAGLTKALATATR